MRSPPPTCRLVGSIVLAAPMTATGAIGQDLGALREQLRDDLRDIHFAQSLLGLVHLSDELELSGARYSFDDVSDTDMTVYALPFHTTKSPWGVDRPRVHIEGTAVRGRPLRATRWQPVVPHRRPDPQRQGLRGQRRRHARPGLPRLDARPPRAVLTVADGSCAARRPRFDAIESPQPLRCFQPSPGMMRFMNSSKSGTVNAVSP